MDWLEQHRANVDIYNNTIECVDGKWILVEVRGILWQILVKNSLALQLQRFLKKKWQVYEDCIFQTQQREKGPSLEYYWVL